MNAIIWQYIVPLIYISGLLVVSIRYHHTRAFMPGFLGFVFLLLAPYAQRWFTQSPSELVWLRIIPMFAWLLGICLILASLVRITQSKSTKASSLYRTTGAILVFLVLAGGSILAVVKELSGTPFIVSLVIRCLAGLGFLGCSVAIFDRFSAKWFGIIGVAAFALLSIKEFLFFGAVVAGLPPKVIMDADPFVTALAWIAALVFFVAVPRSEVDSHPAWIGFRMTQARWSGVAVIVVGLLICAWQIYEVHSGEHFTFWMIGGIIPLPVILLGILAVLGGLVALIKG